MSPDAPVAYASTSSGCPDSWSQLIPAEVTLTGGATRLATGFPPRSSTRHLSGMARPAFATFTPALSTGAWKPSKAWDATRAKIVPLRPVICGVLVVSKSTTAAPYAPVAASYGKDGNAPPLPCTAAHAEPVQ